MRDLFLDTLLQRATTDPRIMLITADLGFRVLDKFRQQLPGQFLNIGIAEQNMIGVATGLALSGRIVFVYSIANFSSLRCLEQIRNDACYHNANVKVISVGAGLSYGQLGISHHATEDIAIMRSIPSLMVCSPGDDEEVIGCTHQIIDQAGTAYLRLDRESTAMRLASSSPFQPAKPRLIAAGATVALISTGGMLSVSFEVADSLAKNGINASIISLHTVSPPDSDTLRDMIHSHAYVFTLEEHSIHGGLGGLVAETILESDGPKPTFLRFGLREGFSSIVGDQQYLRSHYKIDQKAISTRILNVVKSNTQGAHPPNCSNG